LRYTVNVDNAFWRNLDGEAVIINVETSHYYSLNATGTYIWTLLADGALTLEEIVARVAEKYSRPAAEISDDVERILEHLSTENLVTTR
jgi:Coenzyme PQQ synthesis protein D (PqqD)